jgi:hypothetical protein
VTDGRRDLVRTQLLERAEADARVAAAAVPGSSAAGAEDQWSDIDLFFGVTGAEPKVVLEDFSAALHDDFGALHHFDLAAGPAVYRAFLLEGLLEVDLGFAPLEEFRSYGGAPFRVVFGAPGSPTRRDPLDVAHAIGLIWHHVLHARSSIERDKPWQAEYWISAVRDQVLSLAADRNGLPSLYAKGADLLPASTTAPLVDALVRSLDRDALGAALQAASQAALLEIREQDPVSADLLEEPLRSLAGS